MTTLFNRPTRIKLTDEQRAAEDAASNMTERELDIRRQLDALEANARNWTRKDVDARNVLLGELKAEQAAHQARNIALRQKHDDELGRARRDA